jgi:YVTN family beta-propeller protein
MTSSANATQYFSASTLNTKYAGTWYDGSLVYNSFFGRVPVSVAGVEDALGYVTIVGGVPTLRFSMTSTALNLSVPITGNQNASFGTIVATGNVVFGGAAAYSVPFTIANNGSNEMRFNGGTTGYRFNSSDNVSTFVTLSSTALNLSVPITGGQAATLGATSTGALTVTGSIGSTGGVNLSTVNAGITWGTTTYLIGNDTTKSISGYINNALILNATSTGLAVTGAISASNGITSSGGDTSLVFQTLNIAAANAQDFFVKHATGAVSIGAARGNFNIYASNTKIAEMSSTGLAVTGAITSSNSIFAGSAPVRTIKGYFGLLDYCGVVANTATITVGTGPVEIAYCPTNDRIYVSNNGGTSVSVIIPSTGVVTATITVGANPHGIAYCPTNDRIYVSNNGSASVSVIIPSTGVVTATITVGANPHGIAYCPTNDRIYVSNNGSASVSVIIPSTGVVTATITVGANPHGIAYCPTNDRIYVSNYGSASVSVIIPSTGVVTATITVGTGPIGIAYCPTNDRIYVANYGSTSVSVIIPSTGVVTATITVGANPYGIAYCPTNDRIYVTNTGSTSVSVIIPSTGVVTATITVGANPYGIAYCPTNDRIYVSNNGSTSVSVLT